MLPIETAKCIERRTVPDGGQAAGSGTTIDLGGKVAAVLCGSREYGNRMSKSLGTPEPRGFPNNIGA